MSSEFALRMRDITKTFPGVKALNCVNLEVKKGEIHALIGENGAGKTTLMKVLNGLYQPENGTIEIDGKMVNIASRHHALELGISMIFQELSVLPNLDVASNIMLAREPRVHGNTFLVDRKEMNLRAKNVLDSLGINLEPTVSVETLSCGQRQQIEIARAISTDAKIIVMDEPTTSLNRHETESLFNIIRELKKQGKSIIYISHRLEEIMLLADRSTVLRDGNRVAEIDSMKGSNRDEIVNLMVGHSPEVFHRNEIELYEKEQVPILELEDVTAADNSLCGVSFKLRKGEILGVTGLIGSGRSELARLLFGAKKIKSGKILIEGKQVCIRSSAEAIKLGIGYVSDDRKYLSIIPPMNIEENISLVKLRSLSTFCVLNKKKITKEVSKVIDQLRIKIPDKKTQIYKLSGGNQQKCIIGRWMIEKPKILIMNEPTQGVDVGVKAELYKMLDKMTNEGISIIFVSQDFAELVEVSDRIIAMYKGKIQGELKSAEVTDTGIMNYVTGGN